MKNNFTRIYIMCIVFTLCIAVDIYFAYVIGWKFTIMAICGAAFTYLAYLTHKELSTFRSSFYD